MLTFCKSFVCLLFPSQLFIYFLQVGYFYTFCKTTHSNTLGGIFEHLACPRRAKHLGTLFKISQNKQTSKPVLKSFWPRVLQVLKRGLVVRNFVNFIYFIFLCLDMLQCDQIICLYFWSQLFVSFLQVDCLFIRWRVALATTRHLSIQ